MVKIQKVGKSVTTVVDTFEVTGAPDLRQGNRPLAVETLTRTITTGGEVGRRVQVVISGKLRGGALDGFPADLAYEGSTLQMMPRWAQDML